MTEPRACPLVPQAVGLALHALEPDEEMSVLIHVPECPDCIAVLAESEGVLAHLGTAVEQVDPPTGLRSRLLAAAATETPQPIAGGPATTPLPQTPDPRSRPVTAFPGPTGPARTPRRRRRTLTVAAALAALIAIAGLGVRTAQLQNERDVEAARAQSLTTLVQHLAQPHAMLTRDDGTTVAAVVLADGRPEVYPVDLPVNATDHEYVLWGVAGGTPRALGAFNVTGAGQGPRAVGPGSQGGYAAYAVSLEPGRTLPTTPTDVIAKGALKA